MTIVINLGLHGGRIGGIFITGIFGNFYTKRGECLTIKTGIPGGLAWNWHWSSATELFPGKGLQLDLALNVDYH